MNEFMVKFAEIAYNALDCMDAMCDDAFIKEDRDLAICINVAMEDVHDILDSLKKRRDPYEQR